MRLVCFASQYFEMDPLGVPRPSLRERRAEKIRQQVRHSAVDLRKISSVFPTILPALPPASAQESSEPEEFTGF